MIDQYFAVIICVLILFVFLLIIRPKLGLYGLLLFAPFSYYYNYLGRVSSATSGTLLQRGTKDILIILLYLAFVMYMFVKKKVKFSAAPSTYLVLVFFWIVIIQMLRALPYSAYDSMMGMRNMAEYIPLAFIVPALLVTKKDIQKAVNLSLWCGIVLSLLTLYEIYIRTNFFLSTFAFRIFSTLYNPNNLAVYLCIIFLILSAFYINRMFVANKITTISLLIASFTLLILTISRSAMFGTIVAVMFLSFNAKKGKKFLIFSLISILTCLALINVMVTDEKNQLMRYSKIGGVGNVDISTKGRIENITKAFDNIYQQPYLLLTGVGFDKVTGITDINADPGRNAAQWKGTSVIATDNFYLSLLVGGGMFSLLIFFAIFYLLIIESIKFSSKTSDLYFKALSQGISAVFVAYAVISFFSLILATFPGAFYFWFFVGIMLSMRRIEKNCSMVLQSESGSIV